MTIDAIFVHLQEVGREGRIDDASLVARLAEARAELECVHPEAVYLGLTPALCSRHPHVVLQLMHDCGLLAMLLPELEATVDFSADMGRRHKDVWEHTKTVVWQSVPQPAVRWAAALHDIGKVPTRRSLPDGRVTFHGHAELGERMFEQGPAQRLGFPPQLRRRVGELIRWHQRPGHYEPGWSDAAVRRFAREVGPALADLLNLSRADITSQRPGRRKACLYSLSALARRIRALEAEDRRPEHLPKGLGRALMQGLQLSPGPRIGELRARLLQLCEAGTLEGGREASYYVAHARTLAPKAAPESD